MPRRKQRFALLFSGRVLSSACSELLVADRFFTQAGLPASSRANRTRVRAQSFAGASQARISACFWAAREDFQTHIWRVGAEANAISSNVDVVPIQRLISALERPVLHFLVRHPQLNRTEKRGKRPQKIAEHAEPYLQIRAREEAAIPVALAVAMTAKPMAPAPR